VSPVTESPETSIAVLQVQVASILRDAEKREMLHDARHRETMLRLDALSTSVNAAQSFSRGVRAAVATGWALLGGLAVAGFQWLINRGGT
jgi:hypothetical protein